MSTSETYWQMLDVMTQELKEKRQRAPMPPRELPTRLELASALRGAAEFCRDPQSPKCPGFMAARHWSADALTHARSGRVISAAPYDDGATHWCAVGRVCHNLRTGNEGVLFAAFETYGIKADLIYEAFDDLDFLTAAKVCDQAASWLEAQIDGAAVEPFLPDMAMA